MGLDIMLDHEDLECLEIFSGFGCAVAKAFRDRKMGANPDLCNGCV